MGRGETPTPIIDGEAQLLDGELIQRIAHPILAWRRETERLSEERSHGLVEPLSLRQRSLQVGEPHEVGEPAIAAIDGELAAQVSVRNVVQAGQVSQDALHLLLGNPCAECTCPHSSPEYLQSFPSHWNPPMVPNADSLIKPMAAGK